MALSGSYFVAHAMGGPLLLPICVVYVLCFALKVVLNVVVMILIIILTAIFMLYRKYSSSVQIIFDNVFIICGIFFSLKNINGKLVFSSHIHYIKISQVQGDRKSHVPF